MRKVRKFITGETLQKDIGPHLNEIVDRVNSDVKGDGKTVRVSQVGKDYVVSAISRPGGGGGGFFSYEGYFKIENAISESEGIFINVVDGYDSDAVNAGKIKINNEYKDVEKLEEEEITANMTYVFVETEYNESSEEWEAPEIKTSTTFPVDNESLLISRFLLGRVIRNGAGTAIEKILQDSYGMPHITFIKICEEP